MNRDDKRAIFITLANGLISRDEAKKVLKSDPRDRIFKNLIYPDGRIESLSGGDHSLKPILEKSGIDFIQINRILIQKLL